MPVIMATPFPTRGQVLVEVDFADVPAATNICVEAVNTVTGERRQLHPYISYNADGCLALSCGHGIFWDTEIPCGVAVQYCATAINAAGDTVTTSASPLISNTFSTVTASSWPVCDTGQTVTNTGGAAADYSGTGSRGQQANTTTGVARVSSVPMTTTNALASVLMYPTVVALTQTIEQFLWLRADAAGANGYRARIRFNTGGTVDLILEKVVAGVPTTIDGTAIGFMAYGATSVVAVKLQVWGSTISAKAWDFTVAEPAAFQSIATDTTFTAAGTANLSSIRSAGNTNGTVNFQFDNWLVADVCAAPTAITACTTNVTIACDGCFRLGDPLRPCNDIQVCFCYDSANGCGGTSGVFFAGMQPDVYASNAGLMSPVNSIYPIPITRNRRAAAGTFTLVPTSFAARDLLLALLAPGGTLLWRGPSEYGTKDRYLQVGDVPVAPVLADLRVQPRVVDLPFATVKAPIGPSQGICGTRFQDLCTTYMSWDAMVAAGLTYADLLRGQAGSTPANLPNWNLVNSTYASWNALNAAQTSWNDTLAGVP